ncbi:hypothetical protein HUU05_07565 [candidate division KSB1 bacterium]|nr:hypothetical protein [candidate division KSB1 bacterium]
MNQDTIEGLRKLPSFTQRKNPWLMRSLLSMNRFARSRDRPLKFRNDSLVRKMLFSPQVFVAPLCLTRTAVAQEVISFVDGIQACFDLSVKEQFVKPFLHWRVHEEVTFPKDKKSRIQNEFDFSRQRARLIDMTRA